MRVTKDNINKFIEGTRMDCSNKGITNIEYIPDGIKRLYCDNNRLTELPKLPENLIDLHCGDNKLTELPKLPNSLKRLDCRNNNLPYDITIKNFKERIVGDFRITLIRDFRPVRRSQCSLQRD